MNDSTPTVAIEVATTGGPDEGALSAVLRTAERLEERLEEALGAVGLSLSKFDAMDQLIRAGEPLILGDLAGRLRCVRSNVTQLVDRLEAEGLVRRGTCTEDRRAIRAKVTPVGLERHRAGVAAIRVVQQELAERLGAEDRAELVRLLSSVLG
jgi:DNA-binding MarR family transcriptional regulator